MLKDLTLFKQAAFIAGQWIDADPQNGTAVINPASGDIIGYVPKCDTQMVQTALNTAQKVQKFWAVKTANERAVILEHWYSLIMENREDLGHILTLEQGKPLSEALGEIDYGASFIRWFAEEARRVNGEILPGHQTDKRILIMKQPIGVVGAITPWNFPNAMITRKAGPAFAAGCAMVLKPAIQTPFSAIALAILAERAGLPSGLFSVITGSATEIGAVLTQSPIVRKLTFTGSTEVGKKLYAQSAPTIKKLGLELGGNAPFIVFDDADIDAAVKGAVIAKFRNNGQTCVCANRLYIQDSIYDRFATKLKTAVEALKVGDGMEKNIDLGPLIDEAALKKVEDHIADAVNKGGHILLGGKPHTLGGTFFEPTILTDITPKMKMTHEETFGPVAPLIRFKDENDVIAQANNTDFGLASYFYAQDLARVFRVSEALEFGMVGVNTGLISTPEAPFGGIKLSGLGREGSHFGIDDFLELKYVCLGEIK
ncbi:NAD-dependent succinate-semialdehyde dehydrogenase [Bartonella tamiae]|uniref:Succinate-semialdehyde dehydrogenase n=1 Tax=Bartonella tamiae Th239 TaxID=1094558 RepID=J1JZU6_9HYPH|nr:NAD-dependent succinate-semialdehyde dehydrogenase [Bartonella tamiae]EJF90280.1 succinate-semialdehyde dehydrogenase [Bartonella tamiae Th239]EJF93779.1 succinate-semialdehyde dehydrogenase [Bartonella tamiae Th307]